MDLNNLFNLLCDKCRELYSSASENSENTFGNFFNLPTCLEPASEILKNNKTITKLRISSDEFSVPNCKIQKKYFEDDGQMYLVFSVYWVKEYDVRAYVSYPDNVYSFTYENQRTDFLLMDDLILQRINGKSQSVPATVKSLSFVPIELQEILFSYYTDSLIWKDCIRDNFYIPAPIHKLDCYHNKKEYCEKVFKISLPSSANRINFRTLYAVCCCFKYIKEESFKRLIDSDINFQPYVLFNKKKKTASEFLEDFLQSRLPNADKFIIDDFVNMAFTLKEKVDCFAGKKKIYQLHDEYSKRVLQNSLRGKKFEIPDTPLRYLSLPDNYCVLRTKKAFVTEGTINHNCVASYIDKVAKGRCLCCSADIDGEHFTIEIVLRKRKNSYSFSAVQVRGNYNSFPEPHIFNQVEQDLKNATPKAVSLFMKKHNENV